MVSLEGRTALAVGIASENAVARGCARAPEARGAGIAVACLNDEAERVVRPLAEALSDEAAARAPTRGLAAIADLGAGRAVLAPREARAVTGGVRPTDAGFDIVG